MSESLDHIELVHLLKLYLRASENESEFVEFSDEPNELGACLPERIGGYRPDLIWKTRFNQFRFIGEAKTKNDIRRDHTRAQLTSFLSALKYQTEPATLIVAVPRFCESLAESVLSSICEEIVLCPSNFKVISSNSTLLLNECK